MLSINNINDKNKMMHYYRTSDMINLLYFFPELSPVRDLSIVLDYDDYFSNKEFLDSLTEMRVDTVKGRNPSLGIECAKNASRLDVLTKLKEIDPFGVLVLFNVNCISTERYLRLAGISVGVDLGKNVTIEAVSNGFDGREVSKSICTHERYFIPWFDLRKININNFRDYRTFLIDEEEYNKTRLERIEFLKSIGLDYDIFSKYIPKKYQEIPDIVWLSVIKKLLKKLEKMENILSSYDFTNFAISGHTEGCEFTPWQMFDKTRYTMVKK